MSQNYQSQQSANNLGGNQQQSNNEPNSKLLSLLDKMVNPVEKVNLDLFVDGVYSFPEEWKTTDELFSFFTYQIKFMGLEVTDGKIHPRQLTEKELKEQEEAADKKKKKKDGKKEQEVQLSPEEEEALRLQKEKEEEEERIRIEEWNKLDPQTQFYRTQEDKYQCPFMKFTMIRGSAAAEQQEAENNKKDVKKDDKQQQQQQQQQVAENNEENGQQQQVNEEDLLEANQARCLKEGGDMAILDERVYEDGGDYIYFSRFPNLTEDEITKTRKQKPKNLNLNDLNSVLFRAWVDLTEFQEPGCCEIEQRVKIEQVIQDEENPDIPRPELKDTYILIRLRMDPPVTTLITEVQPKISDIIPEAPPIPKLPASKQCIEEFKSEAQLAMESLALEYSQMFSKELNNNQEAKGKNTVTLQKKQEIQKRKEQFIYDFNTTGKYKVLKERLKKSIVKICRDKFQKHGSITGITTDQKDQFYSELYVFLMEQTRQTLADLIQYKREELHEDIVTSYDQTQKERDRVLLHLTKESPQQRLIRKAGEYEILNHMELANKNFMDLIASDGRNPLANFEYCQFLLRKKQFDKAEEMLRIALQFDTENNEYQFLMACLLMRRGRPKESAVFLRDLTEQHPSVVIYNITFSFLYQKFLDQQKLSDKYKRITERVCLRRLGELQAKRSQKTCPNPFEIPSFKNQGNQDQQINKGPSLKPKQWDDNVYQELVQYFAKYNLFELVEKSWDYIYDPTSPQMQLIQCQVYQFNEDYEKCLDILNILLEANPQNSDVIMMKAEICFISDKLYESEDIFLKALKLKEFSKQSDRPERIKKLLSIYLRLGNIYLKRKSWGDAKAIFVRACELKNSSSLSWLGLGIACLRIGQMKEAEEALTQANIYDPFSGDTWGYLALLCLLDNGRFSQANQALRELFKIEESCDLELLEELGDELTRYQYHGTAEKLYTKIIELCGLRKIEPPNYGSLCLKLGKTYQNLKRYTESVESFEEAKLNLDGENEKQHVDEMIEHVRFLVKNPDYESV